MVRRAASCGACRRIAAGYWQEAPRYILRMTKDVLSRRLRTAKPQPSGDRLALTEGDLALFELLNRHGPLPTTYLAAFLRAKSLGYLQWRLTRLYNGTRNTPSLLSRPPQQFQSFAARYQPLLYDLTPASRRLIDERGTTLIERTDPFLHRFMGACVGASIEIGCRKQGLRYIPRMEILAKAGKPLAAQTGRGILIPDDLFGLQYRDGSYRFFAVEIDRQTESLERTTIGYRTFAGKLENYAALMGMQGYKECWGVPNLLVLTVTTSGPHLEGLLGVVRKRIPQQLWTRFLFKAHGEFCMRWRVPETLCHLLLTGWRYADGNLYIADP